MAKNTDKLSTSKLAVKFGMQTNELNRKLAELGFLEKKGKNFHLTSQGKEAGGVMKSTGGRAYVLWDLKIEEKIK